MVTCIWGRMNPITIGHELLVKSAIDYSKKYNSDFRIFLSQSQQTVKNPIDYKLKVQLAIKAFGPLVYHDDDLKTFIDVLVYLNYKYNKIALFCGDDRFGDYDHIIRKYNGTLFNYKSFDVVQLERNGSYSQEISASAAREYAINEKFDLFEKCLPKTLLNESKMLYDIIRKVYSECQKK